MLPALLLSATCRKPEPQVSTNRPVPGQLETSVAGSSFHQSDERSYMGRQLAPTMSHLGAGWLTRAEREQEEQTSKMISALQLQPGQTVCDVGAGNGYHTLMLASAVLPNGTAIAVDLQPEMLSELSERAKAAKISNIKTVVGGEQDPKLSAGTCDLVLLADVYHEFSNPAVMLGKLKDVLKSDGQIALLEFRAEDDNVPIKPEHKMSKAQILKEYEANGFRLQRAVDSLPWQHLMFFGADDNRKR
jgi:cyclopropane fatty-acyl-phospholipid synthase-like methyltransferase